MPAGGRGLSGSLGLQLGQGIPTPPRVQDGDLSRAERVARKRGSCKAPRPSRCVFDHLVAPVLASLGAPLSSTLSLCERHDAETYEDIVEIQAPISLD